MKKVSIMFVTIYMLCVVIVNSQPTFIPASPGTPQYINPPAAIPHIYDIAHTCAHTQTLENIDLLPSNIDVYAYSWSSFNGTVISGSQYPAGFVYKITDDAGNLITENFQQYDAPVSYLDVTVVEENNIVLFITSYYDPIQRGHFYDIWEYLPATSSVNLRLSNRLSFTDIATKISMDAHKTYAVAFTWTAGNQHELFTKPLYKASGLYFEEGPTVRIDNIENAIAPDIAFAHATEFGFLKVRIVYFDAITGDINTISGDYDNMFYSGNSGSFVIDYIENGVFAYASSYNFADAIIHELFSFSLQIDCPDHSEDDKWSYVYSRINNDNLVWAVSNYQSGVTPVLMNISGILKGQMVTIAYAPTDDNRIYFGWHSIYYNTMPPTPNSFNLAGYLSIDRNVDGSYISLPGTFRKVTDPNEGTSKPVMSFSRNNEFNSFFAVYPFEQGTIAHKILPWNYLTFKPSIDNEKSADILTKDIKVIPLPTYSTFALKIVNDETNPNQLIDINVYNSVGMLIIKSTGTFNAINEALVNKSKVLTSGIYYIHLSSPESDKLKVIKAIKM